VSRRTQVTIPEPYQDVRSLQTSVMALKELVEELAGQRGTHEDKAVTFRELRIANINQWQSPGFVNGWTDYGSPYTPCGVCKLVSGLVIMRGLTKDGTATHICTLPVGYRPGVTMLYIAATNPNVACRIDVSPAGVVSHTGGSNAWISLCNVCFLAEN
jgi:hypothetical protein